MKWLGPILVICILVLSFHIIEHKEAKAQDKRVDIVGDTIGDTDIIGGGSCQLIKEEGGLNVFRIRYSSGRGLRNCILILTEDGVAIPIDCGN